ncbi:MAG: threonine/serine dehydratase [Chlamydiales bacterium]|nr:threonine/serine dehydratase [Chlamydiales bacterium]
MFDIKHAEETYHLIEPYIAKTPLVRCFALEKHLNCQHRIFVKCEHLQPTGSFKLRGAFASVLRLSPKQKASGIITRSSGNFGYAVAYVGNQLNIPVTIVMPPHAPMVKQESAKKLGARLILHGNTHLEQLEKVKQLAQSETLTMLHPYDHIGMIDGSATLGYEIKQQLDDVGMVYCQIGGGGLIAGLSACLKNLSPTTQIIGIEPDGANDYFLSREQGHRVMKNDIHTIADGLRAPQVGDLPYPLIEQYVDDVKLVSDQDIIDGMRFLYNQMGMIIEPSGAAPFAYLLKHMQQLPPTNIVCIISGCNVDRDQFTKWMDPLFLSKHFS